MSSMILQENGSYILQENSSFIIIDFTEVSIFDSIAITESATVKVNNVHVVSDLLTITESINIIVNTRCVVSDLLTITENLTAIVPSVLNPTNAYVSDNIYAQITGAVSGQLSISISTDAGFTYTPTLSQTFTSTEEYRSYGSGDTELWGLPLNGGNITNANLRVKISHNNGFQLINQVYSLFGFSIGVTNILTGLQIQAEAKYIVADASIYVDNIHVKVYYGTSILPIQAGSQAYASNGRKNGEGAGLGTGVLVFYDSTGNWIASDSGATVTA